MNYFNELSQEVNKVYKTNDLSIFKQIKGNRPPNPQHIRRLASSIRTSGMLQNPIIVNDKMEIIDGQHRLLAAKEVSSDVYFIILNDYEMKEVQILNLNQKNWTSKDFMHAYAEMGITSYIQLKYFINKNKCFNITDCISLCSNLSSSGSSSISQKFRNGTDKEFKLSEVFQEGTWKGKDFDLAQEWADKIKLCKDYYSGYNKSTFVKTMINLIRNDKFDFFEFLNKLKNQQDKMIDASNIGQCTLIIEDIYNHRRRDKINLRY
jgi:hypothetical protein